MLYNVNDTHVGRSLDLYGEWCEAEVELFSRLLRPGDVAVDVGANVGAHTVALARLVGPRGTVVAFEPQRVIFQALCANVAINSLPNVFCYQSAVGERAGAMVVPPLDPTTEQNFGGFGISGYEQGEPVNIVALDDLPLRRCRLIKVDVEGMELGVIRGAASLIQRCWPILYVENNRPDRSEELVRHIYALGYDLFWHRTPVFNPSNFFGNATNVFGGEMSENMLCLPHNSLHAVEGLDRVRV